MGYFLALITFRCQVNWQLGVSLGVSFGAGKAREISAVLGCLRTTARSASDVPDAAGRFFQGHETQSRALIIVAMVTISGTTCLKSRGGGNHHHHDHHGAHHDADPSRFPAAFVRGRRVSLATVGARERKGGRHQPSTGIGSLERYFCALESLLTPLTCS